MTHTTDQIIDIAKVCHQANKAYCENLYDYSQIDFFECPKWQADSAIKGVQFVLDNPDAPQSAVHDSWMAEKLADGWVYGAVKCVDNKTHPCCVPYDELPLEQQRKDALFKAIVKALS